MTRHSRKRGFNLIEAAIVLGVVGLVIGGIWVAANAVNDHFKVSRTAAGIIYACDRAANIFPRLSAPAEPDETGILSAAIAANVFPADWVNNGVVNSPVSGNVLVTQYKQDLIWSGMYITGVSIYLIDVPEKYCRQVASGLSTKSGSLLQFVIIGTGGNDVNWTSETDYISPFPGNMSDGCASNAMSKLEIHCLTR
mgnify:FL=1